MRVSAALQQRNVQRLPLRQRSMLVALLLVAALAILRSWLYMGAWKGAKIDPLASAQLELQLSEAKSEVSRLKSLKECG